MKDREKRDFRAGERGPVPDRRPGPGGPRGARLDDRYDRPPLPPRGGDSRPYPQSAPPMPDYPGGYAAPYGGAPLPYDRDSRMPYPPRDPYVAPYAGGDRLMPPAAGGRGGDYRDPYPRGGDRGGDRGRPPIRDVPPRGAGPIPPVAAAPYGAPPYPYDRACELAQPALELGMTFVAAFSLPRSPRLRISSGR
jgi:hypothetical protein